MVHLFSYKHKSKDLYFLWDIESGSLHNVDYVAFLCAKNRYEKEFDNQRQRDDFLMIGADIKDDISNELKALEDAGMLLAPPIVDKFVKNASELKALCLHICHDCNMRCDYCFADGGTYSTASDYMSFEVGKRAVDLLIKNSGKKRSLEIDFFGGEPLMNLDVVKEIVDYAKQQAPIYGKEFVFTMTTNCILLSQDNIDYLNNVMDNVVLSIDGKKDTHNKVRHAKNGKDVYELVLKNCLSFQHARGDKKYYVRGTFTANNLDFSEDIFALNDYGFNQISVEPVVLPNGHSLAITTKDVSAVLAEYEKLATGYLDRRNSDKWFNFFHFMIDLDHGPCLNKRLTGCGAGTEYLAVSPTGDIYPCHQFVSQPKYRIGDVFDGIQNQEIRQDFASQTVLNKEYCKDCPAKYYCGGGCAANSYNFTGSISGQYEIGCILAKKRLELSLAIAFIEGQSKA